MTTTTEATLKSLRVSECDHHYGPDCSALGCIFCPLCNCLKSEREDEPNTIHPESCESSYCRCHIDADDLSEAGMVTYRNVGDLSRGTRFEADFNERVSITIHPNGEWKVEERTSNLGGEPDEFAAVAFGREPDAYGALYEAEGAADALVRGEPI